ncbi:hypothetical protein FA95DRAFT_1551638 [Auriscalpium vulgare]|uniref:Uncharacterized protein n=1 Tax=Auriscalpium vulgare TaxID=40419 RepID=A0ACB8SDD9_9AGAM|nr:hypothetical protein FA95DRAFT_1551638 [Auriscalpium vulgare]
MPTVEDIQSYIETAEGYVYQSFVSVTAEMPMISEALHRLWVDVSRFGPAIPEIHIPGLGNFEVPPPPPPPPPPKSVLEKSADWIADHPWKASGIGASVLGLGLLVGYNALQRRHGRLRKSRGAVSTEKRQVVVVLGGDTPLALALIQGLEKSHFIVIASAATPEAAEDLEQKCNGFVRALVLDPSQPETVPIFLRSLASSLSHRFPLNAPGDPHATPASLPYIHSIVSLLSLSSPSSPPAAPLEHLHLQSDYLSYLTATHITPLQVIQALLPLLRTNPARTRDAIASGKGRKNIIFCVPAADACVGLPFAGAKAMSAAATIRAVDILRRELNVARLTGGPETSTPIDVISIDVGLVDTPLTTRRRLLAHDARRDMTSWTPSEKLAYGAAFEATLDEGFAHDVQRRPTDIRDFVNSAVDVVTYGHMRSISIAGFSINLGSMFKWIGCSRYALGAGATTYAIASLLPSILLDAIVAFPHALMLLRNTIRPSPPSIPGAMPATAPPPPVTPTAARPSPKSDSDVADSGAASEHEEHDASETGSEADVESNSGDGAGVGDSWVSLKTTSGTSEESAK